MSKGGMEIDHPMGELATCHSSSWQRHVPLWYSFMHGRLSDNILPVVEEICAVDQMTWSQYSIGHWVCNLLQYSEVSYRCWPGLWCISQLDILFWILSESSTAYCLSWRHLHWFDVVFIVLWILCSLFSPSDENRQLETLGEEFELAEDIWWREHIKLWVLGQQDALALWGQWPYLSILLVWRFVWWDVSVLWGQYLHHRHRALWVGVYHLQGGHRCSSATLIIAYKNNLILIRLYFTLWIGYYSGRKTTAIQLYLADLHCECRTEHSILHRRMKLWDAISMRKSDLEMERCVLIMFRIQKKVVQRTFYEPLRS